MHVDNDTRPQIRGDVLSDVVMQRRYGPGWLRAKRCRRRRGPYLRVSYPKNAKIREICKHCRPMWFGVVVHLYKTFLQPPVGRIANWQCQNEIFLKLCGWSLHWFFPIGTTSWFITAKCGMSGGIYCLFIPVNFISKVYVCLEYFRSEKKQNIGICWFPSPKRTT